MEEIINAPKPKKRLRDRLPCWMTNIHSLFYYFLFLIGLGLLFFCTSLFVNYFTTPFTGDYTAQQYSFYTNGYDDWWHFFRTGEFVLYDRNTFLGADNIGSNSFYYLFDPFFLPILLCPRQLIPQGMAILTIFKIAACGMTFFVYMRYMGASRRAAKITGIAYAFCGWTSWYLWFNHFTEVAIVFPLILLGVEKVLKEKKPWVLAAAVCLMGFTNYFFCLCFTICAFIYAMFRYFQRLPQHNWKDNLLFLGLGFLGFATGLLLCSMVVIPSAMHALTSPRASGNNYLVYLKEAFKENNFKDIWKLLTSWTATSNSLQNKGRLLYPFIDFIFPVTSDRGTPLTLYYDDTYDNVAGSLFVFIPMTMMLVPAVIDSCKQKKFSPLIAIALFAVALFTPICYYLFHGFTQAYSRWTLFVSTSLLAYVGLYLEKLKDEKLWVLLTGAGSTLVFCAVACICANYLVTKYSDAYAERVPIYLAAILEIAYILIASTLIIVFRFKKPKKLYTCFTSFIVVEIALMGAFIIQGHGVEDYAYTNKGVVQNNVLHSLVSKVYKNDNSYYRSYSSLASESADNDEMRNNYNGMNFFHSVYNYNTADICNWSVITNGTAPGSWSGNYVQKRINLDTLLGVKYYYVENDYYEYQNRAEATSERFRYNVPYDYIDVTDQYPNSQFKVYENKNYIDFALTYDTVYITTGNPKENDIYDGLYGNSVSKDVLGIEENYLKAATINTYNDESIIPDIEDNHKDISVVNATVTMPYFYYDTFSSQQYGSTGTWADAYITYYDIPTGVNSKGEKVDSLTLTANEYLTLCNRDNNTFSKSGIPENVSSYRRYVAVLDPTTGDTFNHYDPNGNIYYISSTFASGYEVDIYFVDENGKIITYDNHNDGYHSSSRNGKSWRTFYITPTYGLDDNGDIVIKQAAPKISKIIIASRSNHIPSSFKIYVDDYTSYKAKMDKLSEYRVSNVNSVKTNTYTFSTNFEKERVIVTHLAYEDGWKCTMTDEHGNKSNVKVFNGQGGFATFISGKGNCSYKLTFETPYLQIASLISDLGIFTFIGSLLGYYYVNNMRKKKEPNFDSISR